MKTCPKCHGSMSRKSKINEKVINIDYIYFECRCGYRVKENGEEMERAK